jgi:hypothetical protein
LQKCPASEPKFSIETKDLIEIYGPRIALNLPGNLSVPDFERPAKRLAQLVLWEKQGRMSYKEMFWMACDSTEQLRAEYGPFHTRAEAEQEALKLGFGYLLRYEHVIGEKDDIQEVRCIFIELQPEAARPRYVAEKLHTRCATCGACAVHDYGWQAEVWADIHEFEHSRHRIRLFEQTRAEGLKEVPGWRDACA